MSVYAFFDGGAQFVGQKKRRAGEGTYLGGAPGRRALQRSQNQVREWGHTPGRPLLPLRGNSLSAPAPTTSPEAVPFFAGTAHCALLRLKRSALITRTVPLIHLAFDQPPPPGEGFWASERVVPTADLAPGALAGKRRRKNVPLLKRAPSSASFGASIPIPSVAARHLPLIRGSRPP